MRPLHPKGFTLIELTLAILIVAIIGTALIGTLTGSARAFTSVSQLQSDYGAVRIAVARLTKEMRWTRRDPVLPNDYDINLMTSGQFEFTNEAGITVTLNISGGNLTITYDSIVGTFTLLDNLNSASFSYFDANGAVTASRTDVRRVDLILDSSAMTTANLVSVALRH